MNWWVKFLNSGWAVLLLLLLVVAGYGTFFFLKVRANIIMCNIYYPEVSTLICLSSNKAVVVPEKR